MRRRRERMKQFGGMLAGIGLGLMLAVVFVPKDEQKSFNSHIFLLAPFCISFGGLIANLMPRFLPKKPQDDSEEMD